MRRPSTRNLVIGIVALVAVAVVATAILVPAVAPPPTAGAFTVTILHNNDGESQLAGAPADPAYGGIARFATLVRSLQEAAVRDAGSGAVTVSSGDNYLAGPHFAASLEKGPPFHDSVGLARIGYDALAIGNHEFDFGPDVLADFISGFGDGLEGRREPGIRTQETNLGNLLADALLDAGQDGAAAFGVTPPQVALQNGGGIRNNSLIPAGPVSELDTFSVAAFANHVAVVPDVPRTQFKEILENAVSRIPDADGRFAQLAGFRFTYDAAGAAQVTDEDGTVTAPGARVQEVVLDDGTVVVSGGTVVDGPGVSIATNDFSARGGDSWPFREVPFTSIGVSYQQAMADYLADDLAGSITAQAYPEAGSGRITRLN